MTSYNVVQQDALSYLASLSDQSIDLVCFDPPYESLERWRQMGTTTRLTHSTQSSNDWFRTFPNTQMPSLLRECARVMRPNSHLYLQCDETTRDVVRPLFEPAGLRFHKSLVWSKLAIGMGYHWRASYEFVLFAEKGKRKLNNLGLPDLLRARRLKGPTYYPTQKPAELLQYLISNSSKPGEPILDPFCGSGTPGMVAVRMGRRFMGCDTNPTAVERTQQRLSRARTRYVAQKQHLKSLNVWDLGELEARSNRSANE